MTPADPLSAFHIISACTPEDMNCTPDRCGAGALDVLSGPLKTSSGFTLLELLVTVSVIGILLVLLVPVARTAIGSARTVGCTHSLRQLHSATILYANEHDGTLPLNYWMGKIGPYLGLPTDEPSATERSRNFPLCGAALKRALGIAKTTRDGLGHDNSWIRTHSMNAGLSDTNLVSEDLRLINIPAPAETVLFLDGHPEGGNYPYWRATIRSDSISDVSGMCVHNGRLNGVFFDGHVESRTFGEIPQDVERNRFWNPMAEGSIPPGSGG